MDNDPEEMIYVYYADDGFWGPSAPPAQWPRHQILRFPNEDMLRQFVKWVQEGGTRRRNARIVHAFRRDEFQDIAIDWQIPKE